MPSVAILPTCARVFRVAWMLVSVRRSLATPEPYPHDSPAATPARRSAAAQLCPLDHRLLRAVRRPVRASFRPLARPARRRRDAGLATAFAPGQARLMECLQPVGLCLALLLRHLSGPARDGQGLAVRQTAQDAAVGAQPRRSPAILRRFPQRSRSDDGAHHLRLRPAHRRSHPPARGRHRQSPRRLAGASGQRPQGPAGAVVAAIADGTTRLLAALPAEGLAVSWALRAWAVQHHGPAAAGDAGRARPGLEQACQPAHAAAQLCHPPAGSRRRRGDLAAPAGPQRPADDRTLSACEHAASAAVAQSVGHAGGRAAERQWAAGAGESRMTTPVLQRPLLEVADVLRTHGASYLDAQGPHLSRDQLRAVKELALCRTAALGGHTEHCGGCGTPRVSYNSCRNRHCPKCQGSTRAAWLGREAQTLLPVDYYHVVFTLPAALGPLALQNARVLYDLLLRTVWETVRELASDPHYLGATVGLLAVLHTWGQTLSHHPHVHGVVTGGGLACDVHGRVEEPSRWVSCRPGFFLPVRVLSRLFRGKFLAGLRAAYDDGRVGCHGRLADLAAPAAFAAWLTPLYRADWVVYAKPPFGGPEQVLKYLARYTD